MGEIMKKFLLGLLVSSASILMAEESINHHRHDRDHGSIKISSKGTVKHNGDYAVYNIKFNATCYTDREQAAANVVEQVTDFTTWLDERATGYDNASVDYTVDLINVYKDNNPYYYSPYSRSREEKPNPCYEKYTVNQTMKVKVSKSLNEDYIDSDLVQEFYSELYSYLYTFNYTLAEEGYSSVSTANIYNVEKGIFDSTLRDMRANAYALARENAVNDFLAVLGNDYTGSWYLHKADFTNARYARSTNYSFTDEAHVVGAPVSAPEFDSAPAVVKLDRLSFSVEGVFEFGFTHP